MAAQLKIVFLALFVALSSAATQFGYAPQEPVVSSDDAVQHAYGKITKLSNNFKRLAGNAEKDGNQLLQALAIQSNDPEGLQALIPESKMAIANAKPKDLDVSACESGNDQKYLAAVKEAGPGIQACNQNAAAALQPYFQRLKDMVALSQVKLQGANGNVTNCANTNQGNFNGMTQCLQEVGAQVFVGRDILMAAIMGEMADFRTNTTALVADFTTCTNAVQDKAIAKFVDVIKTSKECIQKTVSSANSTTTS